MSNYKPISGLCPGDVLTNACFLLKEANVCSTKAGRLYLAGVLADKEKEIPLRLWDYAGDSNVSFAGSIVCVSGKIVEYKGELQATLDTIREADEQDGFEESDLIPCATENIGELAVVVFRLLDSMKDTELKAVCRDVYKAYQSQILSYPAAQKVHHAFKGGLLMHTAHMMQIADSLAEIYASTINRDLLLTGTFLHDIGKIYEFLLSPVGLVSDYSVEGVLLGHLFIGAQIVQRSCEKLSISAEKALLLQHMLLSHHGEPEYGAAKRPSTPEAILLSEIDMLDSRMEIVAEALDGIVAGTLSERVNTLGGVKLYKPDLEKKGE